MNAKDYFPDLIQAKLAEAAARGDEDQISRILKQGGDVNAVGREGMRPLFWALAKRSLKGFDCLLRNGANPNVCADARNKDERPLSVMGAVAIAEGTEFLELALKHGGNPDFPAGYGQRTILAEAILNGRVSNVRLLIDSGAAIDHQDSAGLTPIMIAAGVNNYDIVMMLLEKGANPQIKDKWGYDLMGMLHRYGDRGIRRGSDQYRWYSRVVEELGRRGYKVEPKGTRRDN